MHAATRTFAERKLIQGLASARITRGDGKVDAILAAKGHESFDAFVASRPTAQEIRAILDALMRGSIGGS